jgi:hypothetical protein
MNTQDHSESEAPSAKTLLTIDKAALQRMSMRELSDLCHGLDVVSNVLCAMTCQPRFSGANGMMNTAGEVIDAIKDFLGAYATAAHAVAKAAPGLSPAAVEDRAWLILRDAADTADNLQSFAVLAAEMARDHAHALQDNLA